MTRCCKCMILQWRRRESNPGPKTHCSCIYVRSRRTILPRSAPIGGLAPAPAPCFVFASRPVARRSASQLVDALPEALAGLSVGRLSGLLFRQREQLRYRSQLGLPRRIYVGLEPPRHAAKSSAPSSKPIAPGGTVRVDHTPRRTPVKRCDRARRKQAGQPDARPRRRGGARLRERGARRSPRPPCPEWSSV